MVVKLEDTETERMVDRLSDMPESLQLRILSCVDVRQGVQTMVLSKSWVSSWTCIPVLNFSSDVFKQLHVFDDFVANALSRRQPVKLDRLTFKCGKTCNGKVLEKVFDYAFSHGVEELEANVVPKMDIVNSWRWPIRSSDSLTSLKLETRFHVFFEPKSVFKNLTNLHLVAVIITVLNPFSGFPALSKLRMVSCYIKTDGYALNVHAPQLLEFTFITNIENVTRCELTTPKLRYFEWDGYDFPRFKAHITVVDTVVINHSGTMQEKVMFDNLLLLFNTLCNAKSLTLSASVVHMLTLFPVVNGSSPFRALKCLKLDFGSHHLNFTVTSLSVNETLILVPSVKAYLLHKSRDAKFTIINHPNAHKVMCEPTQQAQAAQSRPKRVVKKPARFLD